MKMKFGFTVALVLVGITGTFLFASPHASADTFNPSRIIDDSVFDNYNSMSAGQIDAFLNTFPSSCISTNNHFSSPDPTGYSYANGFTYGANVSAGTVLAHAAQAYQINPQVLLSTLQKEQSLVTGGKGCYPNTPNPTITDRCDLYGNGTTYNCTDACPFSLGGGCVPIAVGYGCPSRCNADQEGFTSQIIRAAWLFKFGEQRAEGNVGWAIINGNWDNSDDPQSCYGGPMTQGTFSRGPSQCGATTYYDGYKTIDGTSILIANGATAALYWYTPHFSGNQNFFSIFTGWFGPTLGIQRNATITSVTNQSSWLEFSQTQVVTVIVQNTGTETWCADGSCTAGQSPTRLVTQGYQPFAFYDKTNPSWINASQISMQTPTVAPGASGTFTFNVTAPYYAVSASNRFFLVVGGLTFVQGANVWIGAHSFLPQAPTLISQTQQSTTNLLPNQKLAATVTIRNNSKSIWYSDSSLAPGRKPTRLFVPGYSASPFYDKSDPNWLTPSQIAMTTPVVNPGDNAVFQFNLVGPLKSVSTPLKLLPVIDGGSALQDIGISLNVVTPEPNLSYSFVSASFPPAQTTAGTVSTQKATVTIKNTSNTVWYNDASGSSNPTRLVTIFPIYRASPFYDSADTADWLTPSQIAMTTPVVNPGDNAVFQFNWVAPAKPGNYLEYFSLVTDGYKFFPFYGSAWQTIVN